MVFVDGKSVDVEVPAAGFLSRSMLENACLINECRKLIHSKVRMACMVLILLVILLDNPL